MKILFFDTETNGLPKNWTAPVEEIDNWPRLVQIAWQVYNHKGDLLEEYEYVIKPVGFKIPLAASAVHKITTEKALEIGEDLLKILKIFSSSVNGCSLLVAHNYSFDYNIMGAELLRNGLENSLQGKDHMCTMKSTTDFCKIPGNYGYKWPKLEELYDILFSESFNAHDALDDIKATARCFWLLEKKGVISIFKYIKPEKTIETTPSKLGGDSGSAYTKREKEMLDSLDNFRKKYMSVESYTSPLKEPANQTVIKQQRQGEDKSFYESGKLAYTSTYVNDNLHGETKSFYESGKLKGTRNYVDGKHQGEAKSFYESGKLAYTSTYVNDNLHGETKSFYETGKLKGTRNYVDGKQQGEAKSFYESGKLAYTSTYVDGKKQGEDKWFYESGKLKETLTYVNDNMHGETKSFYESGKLKYTGTCVNDNLHGEAKSFYESGKLKDTSTYVKGRRQ